MVISVVVVNLLICMYVCEYVYLRSWGVRRFGYATKIMMMMMMATRESIREATTESRIWISSQMKSRKHSCCCYCYCLSASPHTDTYTSVLLRVWVRLLLDARSGRVTRRIRCAGWPLCLFVVLFYDTMMQNMFGTYFSQLSLAFLWNISTYIEYSAI